MGAFSLSDVREQQEGPPVQPDTFMKHEIWAGVTVPSVQDAARSRRALSELAHPPRHSDGNRWMMPSVFPPEAISSASW